MRDSQSYPYDTANMIDSITISPGEGIYQALKRTLSEKLSQKYKQEKIQLTANKTTELQILTHDICQKMKKAGNTKCIVQPGEIIPITYIKQSHIADKDLGIWTEYKDKAGIWEGYLKKNKWNGVIKYTDRKTNRKYYIHITPTGEYVLM